MTTIKLNQLIEKHKWRLHRTPKIGGDNVG